MNTDNLDNSKTDDEIKIVVFTRLTISMSLLIVAAYLVRFETGLKNQKKKKKFISIITKKII